MKRRQFSSCDACRSSKRRCQLATQQDSWGEAVCSNCLRLGVRCTFEFVSANRRSRHQRGPRRATREAATLSRGGQLSTACSPTAGHIGAPVAGDPFAGFDQDFVFWPNYHMTGPDDSGTTPFDVPWFEEPLVPELWDIPMPSGSLTSTTDQSQPTPQTLSQPHEMARLGPVHEQICVTMLSPYSPMSLLNFTLETNILSGLLCKISNTILTMSCSSFLSHGCNLFSKRRRYWFEDSTHLSPSITFEMESDIFGSPTESGNLPAWNRRVPQEPSLQHSMRAHDSGAELQAPKDITHRLTPLGVIRFLDHFGSIYGNSLSPVVHDQCDTVLTDVLRVFAIQWMSSKRRSPEHFSEDSTQSGALFLGSTNPEEISDLGSKAYAEAWYKARSSIEQTRMIRSFRVIYALFLFDMTTAPAHKCAPHTSQSSEFLDDGLHHLCTLEVLVQAHCKSLGESSHYANLLEVSLDIVRWFGFIRDTTTSLLSTRKCQYPDTFHGRHRCKIAYAVLDYQILTHHS